MTAITMSRPLMISASVGLPVYDFKPSRHDFACGYSASAETGQVERNKTISTFHHRPPGRSLVWFWEGTAADKLASLLDSEALFMSAVRLEEHFEAIQTLLDGMKQYLGEDFPDTREAFLKSLRISLQTEPEGQVLICRDEQVVGYIGFSMRAVKDEQGRPIGELENCHLVSEYQQRGIGSAVLEFLEEQYRARSIDISQMRTLSKNQAAVRFYKARGYQVVKITDLKASISQALLLRKSL